MQTKKTNGQMLNIFNRTENAPLSTVSVIAQMGERARVDNMRCARDARAT